MFKNKRYLVNISLAFAVLGLAFLPLILSHIQDKGFLSRLYTSKFEANTLSDLPELPAEEKLSLIVNYFKKTKT